MNEYRHWIEHDSSGSFLLLARSRSTSFFLFHVIQKRGSFNGVLKTHRNRPGANKLYPAAVQVCAGIYFTEIIRDNARCFSIILLLDVIAFL